MAFEKFCEENLKDIEQPPLEIKVANMHVAPYDTSVAAARTCYSGKGIISKEDITQDNRERIGKNIYKSGHTTPFLHSYVTFTVGGISRQFAWTFLHSHQFYNSEQVSQRYVEMNVPRVFVPPLEGEAAQKIFKNSILDSWKAYFELSKILFEDVRGIMASIGRLKGQKDKEIERDAKKKSIEKARYVIPVAAVTYMYHTISVLELLRYQRMMHACDTPYESSLVVNRMVEAVNELDPHLFEQVGREPFSENELLESKPFTPDTDLPKEFDRSLEGRISKLIDYQPNAEKKLADAVRYVRMERLSDEDAIRLALDPARNPYLAETEDVRGHSPIMRALFKVQYGFRKKISHTADSQDQRHRMVPGSMPMLIYTHSKEPDVIIPEVIQGNSRARQIFWDAVEKQWQAKNDLINSGISPEFAIYTLPNAMAIRLEQSGSLVALSHKWGLRTCFNAQDEIYKSAMDEVEQVFAVHPLIGKYMGPPCTRMAAQTKERLNKIAEGYSKEGVSCPPECPEGDRYCGIQVWKNFPHVKRPY